MYRYVCKRVKETFEFGVNIRKSYACQKVNSNNKNQNERQQQQHQQHQQQEPDSIIKFQEVNFLPSPVENQRKNYDDFKRRYSCKHPNSFNPFLQAITWSTALIAGFYTSKLLCLYRRNHRFDTQNCFYTRYLSQKNRLLHKRFFCVREAAAQRNHNRHRSFVPSQQKFKCPLKNEKSIKSSSSSLATHNASPTNSDDFQQFKESFSFAGLFDKRFEKFYENLSDTSTYKKVYNVNNDLADTFFKTKDDKHEKQTDKNNNNKRNDESNDAQQASTTSKKDTDEAIDAIMENLADVVGELEYQMGCQFFQNDQYAEAADHFRMSANFNHRSAFFNLALIYEEGLGVKKDTQIAHRLYESAANLGHDKALFNLGVYAAKGIGGAKKSFRQAKKCFEKSAALGNADALEALSLLLPDKRKPYLRVPSDFIVADDFTLLSGKIQNHHTNNLRSIAIT